MLEESSKLEEMQIELEALHLCNAGLEKRDPPQEPLEGKQPTIKDLCAKSSLTAKVDQFLGHLDDSSSRDRDDGKNPKKKSTKGRHHTLKSEKASKLTSCVVNPQLWPHGHLSLLHISRDKKYDELTLAEFAAGDAAILQRPNLPPQELCACIVHLSSLLYLATRVTWSSIRDLHAAVRFEIECGQASWGDLFTHLESQILQASVGKQSRAGASHPEGLWWCSLAEIVSMDPISFPRITTVLFGASANGYNIFELGAGWTRASLLIIRNF